MRPPLCYSCPLEPERPEAVSPDRALCLPTFSHLLIVNKLLTHSLSLSLLVFLEGFSWRKVRFGLRSGDALDPRY
jgi:hypothetical protein